MASTFENCKPGCSIIMMTDKHRGVPKFTKGILLKLKREEGIIIAAHVRFYIHGKPGCYQMRLPINMIQLE